MNRRRSRAMLTSMGTAPNGSRKTRRVVIVGDPVGETHVGLLAGWGALGIDVTVAAPTEVRTVARPGDVILGRIDVLPTLDGVQPGLLDLLLLERGGATVLNGAFSLLVAHDKLRTARVLGGAGLPHPRTTVVRDGDIGPLRPPVVVKPRFGSWGIDVFRCETQAELERRLRDLASRRWFRRHGALVQELVPSRGRDLRVVVAAGHVVGAIERQAAPGEWRTNVSLGGSFVAAIPQAGARALAIAAATAVGADVIGVDLLPLGDGYTIVELNGSVDFDGRYSLPGRSIYADSASALRLVRPTRQPLGIAPPPSFVG